MKKYQDESDILDDITVRLDALAAIMRALYDKYCNGYNELDADTFNSFSCAFSMAIENLIDLAEDADDTRSKFYK